MKKSARPDAKLKVLPDPVQRQLFELYQKSSGAACLAWLKEHHGVTSSTGALSAFCAWYPFSRPLEQVREHAEIFKARLKADPNLKLDAEQLSIAGQIAFEQQALSMQNWEAFVSLRKVRLKEQEQALSERRIKLLEKQAAQAEAAEGVTRDATLTPAQREQKLREIFGIRTKG